MGGWCSATSTILPGWSSLLHNKETVCSLQARKMQVLLPDIMETLRHANTDVKMKSLEFFRNMMGHMKRKEASLIALQLAEKLLPLFDDVRLLWEPQPYRWVLCKEGCPPAQLQIWSTVPVFRI